MSAHLPRFLASFGPPSSGFGVAPAASSPRPLPRRTLRWAERETQPSAPYAVSQVVRAIDTEVCSSDPVDGGGTLATTATNRGACVGNQRSIESCRVPLYHAPAVDGSVQVRSDKCGC